MVIMKEEQESAMQIATDWVSTLCQVLFYALYMYPISSSLQSYKRIAAVVFISQMMKLKPRVLELLRQGYTSSKW